MKKSDKNNERLGDESGQVEGDARGTDSYALSSVPPARHNDIVSRVVLAIPARFRIG